MFAMKSTSNDRMNAMKVIHRVVSWKIVLHIQGRSKN